ncbi:MAG: TlpA family protein disulfide reductase [Candidatus Omnitrophica bacterium]|nr:TlpA family protein disulfide reductase [Candidatus Omnitrophota bacterium]
MRRFSVSMILLAGLVSVVLLGGCGSEPAPPQTAEGDFKDFTLKDLSNNDVSLKDFEGKVIMLNFFATWCPPCRHEIPDFVELYNEYKDEGFVIIGVAQDREGLSAVKPFAQKYNITYPVLIEDGSANKLYGPIRAIPTTLIIDREGNIANKFIGSKEKSVFEGEIKKLF